MKNFLLIVEGEKTEYEIFSAVFERYGFHVSRKGRISSFSDFYVDQTEFVSSDANIIIAQAPKNRLGELLSSIKDENGSIDYEKAFLDHDRMFNGIFLIFDVDHTSKEALKALMDFYCDETDIGLLIISSPCIEILSEPGRTEELKVDHLSRYKRQRSEVINKELRLGCSVSKYIADNFESLALQFLEMNLTDSGDKNVMEHPAFVVSECNKLNDRSPNEVVFKYFTTVTYVVLAVVMGLTREIENYDTVKSFLEKASQR